MTREQRLQLARLCHFKMCDSMSTYVFQPLSSKTIISIARTEPSYTEVKRGNYSLIDCRNQPLPEDIEAKIDELLIDRVYQIHNKTGASMSEVADILKEVRV